MAFNHISFTNKPGCNLTYFFMECLALSLLYTSIALTVQLLHIFNSFLCTENGMPVVYIPDFVLYTLLKTKNAFHSNQ